MTTKSMIADQHLLKDIFNDIDKDGDGCFSREEMFDHLKKTKEREFDRKEEAIDRALSDASPTSATATLGFPNAKVLGDDKERLV